MRIGSLMTPWIGSFTELQARAFATWVDTGAYNSRDSVCVFFFTTYHYHHHHHHLHYHRGVRRYTFFLNLGFCSGEALTPSARETTGARSRYGGARFRARPRFSSEGAVIVGCFARAPRKKSSPSNARSFRRLTKASTARYEPKGEGGIARRAQL